MTCMLPALPVTVDSYLVYQTPNHISCTPPLVGWYKQTGGKSIGNNRLLRHGILAAATVSATYFLLTNGIVKEFKGIKLWRENLTLTNFTVDVTCKTWTKISTPCPPPRHVSSLPPNYKTIFRTWNRKPSAETRTKFYLTRNPTQL